MVWEQRATPTARVKVVLVDDDAEVLRSTSRFLAHRGLEVISTGSPFGVSALVLQNSPAALILDVNMPALGGHALARLIRHNAEIRCPIIYYSAMLEDQLRALAQETPGTRYVLKADGADRLYEAIFAATARR